MSSPQTYNDLVSAIITVAEDTSTEFAAYIPTAIGFAEDRLFRNLDFDFSKSSSYALSSGITTLSKPSDHRITHNVYLTNAGEKIRLIKKTEDFLYSYWPNSSTTGVPKYYTDKDISTWMFAPTPNAAYSVTIEYTYKPTNLSVSNQTNVFTTYCPDLLFYATMSAMSEWMKDPEGKQIWEAKYKEAVDTANNEGRRARQDDANNHNNTDSGRNLLQKGSA